MIAAVGESSGRGRRRLETRADGLVRRLPELLQLFRPRPRYTPASGIVPDGTPDIHDGIFERLENFIIGVTEPGICLVVNCNGQMVMCIELGEGIPKEIGQGLDHVLDFLIWYKAKRDSGTGMGRDERSIGAGNLVSMNCQIRLSPTSHK